MAMKLDSTPAAGAFSFLDDPTHSLAVENDDLRKCLFQFNAPVYAVREDEKVGLTNTGNSIALDGKLSNLAGWLPPLSLSQFGEPSFCSAYGVKAAYYTGGMANAIASEEMVIELAKTGLLGSFGSGGISMERLQKAIETIQAAIPDGRYVLICYIILLSRKSNNRQLISILKTTFERWRPQPISA